MKFYIGKIEQRHGEYEFTAVIKFKTVDFPDVCLDSIIKDWFGERDEESISDNGYTFHGGQIFIEAGAIQEVSESVYNEITIINEVS